MRILLITPIFPPDRGGAALAFNYLVEIFGADNRISEILVLSNWREAKTLILEKGKVKHLKLLKYGKTKNFLTILEWNAFVIREVIKHFCPDLIIFHSVILPFRDYYPELFRDIGNCKLYLYKTDLFPVPDFPHLSGIVYLAQNIGTMLRQQGVPEEKLYYIPLLFKPPLPARQLRLPNFNYILFVGSTDPLKGFYQLVKAFRILRKKKYSVKLVVIGADAEGTVFDPEIVLLNELNRGEVAAYIERAEAVVIPSYSEGLPRVALETLYLDRPLIITSIVEETRHLEDTQVLDSNEPEEIARKISAILKGAPYSTRFPWEEFAFDKSAASWIRLLENVGSQGKLKKDDYPAFVNELINRYKSQDIGPASGMDGILQIQVLESLDSTNGIDLLERVAVHRNLMNREKKKLLKKILDRLFEDFGISIDVMRLKNLFNPLTPLTAHDLLFLGNYCLKLDNPEAARGFYYKGLEEGPESVHLSIYARLLDSSEIVLADMERQEMQGRLSRLMKAVCDFLEIKTVKSDSHRYRLASLQKQLNRFIQAEKGFKEIAEAATDTEYKAGALFHLGEIAYSRQQYRSAKKYFIDTQTLIPGHRKAALYLRELDFILGFPDERSFKELYDTASEMNRNGDTKSAENLWRFLLNNRDKIQPHYIGATSFKLGELAYANGDRETASQYFEECLIYIPNHIKALLYSGKFDCLRKEWERNKSEVEKVMANESFRVNIPEESRETQYEKNTVNDAATYYKYLVSAIISTYNSEAHIRGCLEDLQSQTVAEKLEIIVVNSGSNQNEEAIVREFQQKYDNIVYIGTEERETIYKAWNRAIKVARGKYITNANTDDRHRRDALEIMAGYLENHPEVAVVYAKQFIVDTLDETFETASPSGRLDWPEYERETLLEYCCIGPQPMWRTSVHREHGFYFDESLEVSGDYDFWLRLSQHFKFQLIEDYLGLYYRSLDSTNKEWQDRYLTLNEQYSVQRKYYWLMLQSLSDNNFKKLVNNTLRQIGTVLLVLKDIGTEVRREFIYRTWALSVQMEFTEQLYLSKQIAVRALRLMGDGNRLARHIMQLNLSAPQQIVEGTHLVSIVIPYFNNHATIGETLRSIANQSYNSIETIIVNCGSTSSSLSQLHKIVKTLPELEILVITDGAINTKPRRNIAIEKAKGHFILPLDADDLLAATYVEKTLAEFETDDSPDVVYTETVVFGFINELWVTGDFSYSGIYNRNQLNVTALIKKDAIDEVGGYRENLPGYEDWDLWIRFSLKNKRFKRIPEPLFFYRKTTGSRGYLSQHKDLEKRLALIENNLEIYRIPKQSEMKILEQNPHYIPQIFITEENER